MSSGCAHPGVQWPNPEMSSRALHVRDERFPGVEKRWDTAEQLLSMPSRGGQERRMSVVEMRCRWYGNTKPASETAQSGRVGGRGWVSAWAVDTVDERELRWWQPSAEAGGELLSRCQCVSSAVEAEPVAGANTAVSYERGHLR